LNRFENVVQKEGAIGRAKAAIAVHDPVDGLTPGAKVMA